MRLASTIALSFLSVFFIPQLARATPDGSPIYLILASFVIGVPIWMVLGTVLVKTVERLFPIKKFSVVTSLGYVLLSGIGCLMLGSFLARTMYPEQVTAGPVAILDRGDYVARITVYFLLNFALLALGRVLLGFSGLTINQKRWCVAYIFLFLSGIVLLTYLAGKT